MNLRVTHAGFENCTEYFRTSPRARGLLRAIVIKEEQAGSQLLKLSFPSRDMLSIYSFRSNSGVCLDFACGEAAEEARTNERGLVVMRRE